MLTLQEAPSNSFTSHYSPRRTSYLGIFQKRKPGFKKLKQRTQGHAIGNQQRAQMQVLWLKKLILVTPLK